MSDKVQILFGLFAGLAIFIFGMNMMSECLQKAAGEKMRTILSMLTGNPVLGVPGGRDPFYLVREAVCGADPLYLAQGERGGRHLQTDCQRAHGF